MTHKQTHLFDKTNTEKFNEFDRANPHVFAMFEKYAFEIIRSGKKIVPHNLIIERLRWDFYFETTDENSGFKINNNYRSHYGRKFVRKYPEHTEKFNFRFMKTA